jgi:hypothetical protein
LLLIVEDLLVKWFFGALAALLLYLTVAALFDDQGGQRFAVLCGIGAFYAGRAAYRRARKLSASP